MDSVINPKRRYSDTVPLEGHEANAALRIKNDAKKGMRYSDDLLGRRFSKADESKIITVEETCLKQTDLIISRTDTRGTITYCNNKFVALSGWTEEELLGSNHNLIRHPDMPRIAYKLAWDIVKARREFYGYVKNLRKDGGFYWVFAYITADFDEAGEIEGYTSYRRFAPRLAINALEPVYKLLVAAEKKGGMEASEALLHNYLEKNGFASYDQFIVDLQIKANASLLD